MGKLYNVIRESELFRVALKNVSVTKNTIDMKNKFTLLFSLLISILYFSCSKENDTVVPVTAKEPQNLKATIIDKTSKVSWDVLPKETYSFQLAEDDKFSSIIFDNTDKKKTEEEIIILDNSSKKGHITFGNIPSDKKYYFRVRSQILEEKTLKPTSISPYSTTSFWIEDDTKPALPTTEVDEFDVTFASFALPYPEGFNQSHQLEVELEVSTSETFDQSNTYRYYRDSVNANDLVPETKYFYRIIPTDLNPNYRASETLSLTTSSLPKLENEKVKFLEIGHSLQYFTVEFVPEDIFSVAVAISQFAKFSATTEVATNSTFDSPSTEKESKEVTSGEPPFGFFESCKYLGKKIYGRTYLNAGGVQGEYSETIEKVMPNAVVTIEDDHHQLNKTSTSTLNLIHLENESMEIKLSIPQLKEGENKVKFGKNEVNNFSVFIEGVEYSSAFSNDVSQSFTITLHNTKGTISMNSLYEVLTIYDSTQKRYVSLTNFGLGVKS